MCNVCCNKLYIINLSHTLAREILLSPRNSADLSSCSPAHMCNQLACQRTHQQVPTDAPRPTCVSNYWHAARRSQCRRRPVHMCSQLLARRPPQPQAHAHTTCARLMTLTVVWHRAQPITAQHANQSAFARDHILASCQPINVQQL